MEGQDNIIVFGSYDSAIDASIAKSKLDAHGIPCFITDENISGLYPGVHFPGMRTRLHIFADDKASALKILDENYLQVTSDHCPRCNSSRTTRDFPKSESESLMMIFFGVLFPHKKVNRCLDCDNEF
jgi:hypothetical protein